MRASDADRDIVLRALGEAYAEGRIDRGEYDERADAVHTAKTLGELPGLLDDLVPVRRSGVRDRGVALDVRSVEERAVARWERSATRGLHGVPDPDPGLLGDLGDHHVRRLPVAGLPDDRHVDPAARHDASRRRT